MTIEQVKAAIPHRGNMLLVDEVVEQTENTIHCRKTFREDEYFYDGHYPGNPITPGVILTEAAVQAGAILGQSFAGNVTPVLARISEVRFKEPVFPGDTVDLYAKFEESSSGFYFFSGKVTCNGKLNVRLKYVSTFLERDSGGKNDS